MSRGERKWRFRERSEWKAWITPRLTREREVCRWLVFPHSFAAEFVEAVLAEWAVGSDDRLLDPFVGSGTTLVAARERGVPATGFDLSPVAVLAARTKVAELSGSRLRDLWRALSEPAPSGRRRSTGRDYPDLVRRALPGGRLRRLDALMARIEGLDGDEAEQDFFRLALLGVIPEFSEAVADGGWLRWRRDGAAAEGVEEAFLERAEVMIGDLGSAPVRGSGHWNARRADAREIPERDGSFSVVITSPPYPNRHDYTRVFGIELLFAFLDEEANRALRRQTFHSHPEAKPRRGDTRGYGAPEGLAERVARVADGRIRRMLDGYFLDLYLCLREVRRLCREGSPIAFVVGNVRYDGIPFPVDEYTAEVGETAGLECAEIRVVRRRGNSAQQMGRYGREAARESVVIFRRP